MIKQKQKLLRVKKKNVYMSINGKIIKYFRNTINVYSLISHE